MLECYICGKKTRVQYFDYVRGQFILVDKCTNPFCKTHNKYK